MSSWQVVLLEPARTVLAKIGSFLVNVLLVLIVLLIGWLIAKVAKAVVVKALKAVKLDDLSERFELDTLIAKSGINYSLSELIGLIVYWLGLLVAIMVAADIIHLQAATVLLDRLVLFIPRAVAALLIIIFGMFGATMLKNIVMAAASNAGLAQAKMLSRVAEGMVIVFAIFIALQQLKVVHLTELVVGIILSSIGLGLALAFGLGCKDLVGKFVEDWFNKSKK